MQKTVKKVGSLGKRIREARKSKGYSQEALAQFLELNRIASISDYENDKLEPNLTKLRKIAELGSVSLDWLINGEGLAGIETPVQYANGEDMGEDFILVPRYDVELSAGGGAATIHSDQIVDHLAFKKMWIKKEMGLIASKLALVTAIGDSMEPTVRESDLLLLDLTQNEIKDDAIYALRLNNHLLAKRIQRTFDGGVTIVSDNSIYPPQTISKEDLDELEIIGRVVWMGKKL